MLGLYCALVIIIGVPLYIVLASIAFLVEEIANIGTTINRKLFCLRPQMSRNLRYSLCAMVTVSTVLLISIVIIGMGVAIYFVLVHKGVSVLKVAAHGIGVGAVLLTIGHLAADD